MLGKRFLIAALLLGRLTFASAGTAPDQLSQDLAAVRAEAFVMPGAAIRKVDALKAGREGRELGNLLLAASLAHVQLGRKDEAVDAAAQAEQLARTAHDDALLARALLAHARALSTLVHDQEAAGRLVDDAERLAGATEDAPLKAEVLVARGLLAEAEGGSEEALALMTRAVTAARAGDDADVTAMALRIQARLLAEDGQYRQALACIDEVNGLARASRMPARIAQARLAEYAIAARAGQAKQARTALELAIDVLRQLQARESLVVPLVNLADLYIQEKRYGEAARLSEQALRAAREAGDAHGSQLASFELGLTNIYFRDIASGRALVDGALANLSNDDRYLPMLLAYGHALSQVGDGDRALTVYRKAGAVAQTDWRRVRQLSYQSLQRAWDSQRKQNELAALRHQGDLKAAELANEKRLKMSWVLLSVTTLLAAAVIGVLYRRVANTNRQLAAKNEQLFRQSTRDSLTSLFNRHYFYEHVVPRRLPRAAGGVFALFDVDRFKSINDNHGHAAGDVVLKEVAARLSAALREQDVLIRWGGEEFLAYLPEVATAEARRVCARLLDAVGSSPIDIGAHQLTVTISIGFCPQPTAAEHRNLGWERLVHLADLCLYLAKTAGRNQAFGIDDANVLVPDVLAAADADLQQASTDGLVELVNVKSAPAYS